MWWNRIQEVDRNQTQLRDLVEALSTRVAALEAELKSENTLIKSKLNEY